MHTAWILRELADEIETGTDWIINERDRTYIRRRINEKWPDADVTFWDGTYNAIINPHLHEFLEHAWSSRRQYLKNEHDCDDFARHLWAEATQHRVTGLGLVVNGKHAFNINVHPGPKSPVLIEPQTGQVVEADDDLYDMTGADIYF